MKSLDFNVQERPNKLIEREFMDIYDKPTTKKLGLFKKIINWKLDAKVGTLSFDHITTDVVNLA